MWEPMNIFEFDDYRLFLKRALSLGPKRGWGQKTRLAEAIGVNSTFVTQVLTGQKDFSLEQAKKVAEFFLLPTLEEDFFLILVLIARAGSKNLRDYFIEKKLSLRKNSLKLVKRLEAKKDLTDLERSIFYSSRVYSSVHLFTSLGSGKKLEEISVRFGLSSKQTLDIVQFLSSCGLIEKVQDVYRMSKSSTFIEKESPFAKSHHMNWRVKSIEKAEKLSDEELIYTGNYSLSKKDFLRIREELVRKIQEVLAVVKDSEAEELANLNIDFYWQ